MVLPFARFEILENSMSPFLHSHDRVFVISYFFSKPKVGDVIIFKHTTPPYVFCKRISEITTKNVFVTGDNKKLSIDSRKFGYIKKSDIIGKVLFKL